MEIMIEWREKLKMIATEQLSKDWAASVYAFFKLLSIMIYISSCRMYQF